MVERQYVSLQPCWCEEVLTMLQGFSSIFGDCIVSCIISQLKLELMDEYLVRMATAQGKQGIWLLTFQTGKTQGI